MIDSTPEFNSLVSERYRRMTPIERVKVASDMFDTARVIVESSLPPQLDAHARRRAVMLRIYGDEIDIAAIDAAAAAADG